MAALDRSLSWARDSSAPHPGGHTAVIITTLIAEEGSGIHCGNKEAAHRAASSIRAGPRYRSRQARVS